MSMSASATEIQKYEVIINGLRVNELQSLLSQFKSPKLGKKQELIHRCIGLLRSPQHQIDFIKAIADMSKRIPRPAPYPAPASRGYGNSMNGVTMYGAAGGATMYGAQQQHNVAPMMGQTRMVRGLRPLPLPFFDSISTIQEPVELSAVPSGIKTQQRQQILFVIPTDKKQSVNYRSESMALPRFELQLRFFHLAGDWMSQELPDDFPLNVNVRIDDQVVMLPNIIPTNKPNVEPKRPSRPVNITQYCQPPRDNMSRPHRMTIEWTGDKRAWCLAIYLVHRVTSDILKDRALKNEMHRQPLESTKQTIIRRLGTGDEDGITMDQLKISLLCPLGKTRMVLPARCRDCTHLQCFDLDLFLKMNEKRPTWKCAVCSGNAPYHRLIIDGYFQAMLRDVNNSTTEVELLRDGSYQTIKEEVFDLSDDDAMDGGDARVKSTEQSATTSAANSVGGASGVSKKPSHAADDDIIVLDSDDDEDMQRAVEASTQSLQKPASISSNQQQRHGSTTSSTSTAAATTPGGAVPSSFVNSTPPRSHNSNNNSADDSVIIIDLDTPPRPSASASSASAAAAAAARVAMVAPQVRQQSSTAVSSQLQQQMHAAMTSVAAASVTQPTTSMAGAPRDPSPPPAYHSVAAQQYMQQQGQMGMMPQYYAQMQWRGPMNGGTPRSPTQGGPAGGSARERELNQYLQQQQQQQQQLLGRHAFSVAPAFQYGSNGTGNGYPPASTANGAAAGQQPTHGGLNLAQVLQTLQQGQHHQQQPGGGYPNYHNGQ